MKKRVNILLLLFFTTSILVAQTSTISVKKFEIKDGLSQNHTNCLMQDHNGIIWIGSQNGLNKYDGYEFTIYRQNSSSNSLSDNYINQITEDDNGNLWIATESGLSRFNAQKNIFTSFLQNTGKQKSMSKNIVHYVYLDKNKDIWALTDSILVKFNKSDSTFKHFEIPTNSKITLSNYNNLSIIDYDNGLLLATKAGLVYFDFNTLSATKPFKHKNNDLSTISHQQITTIYRDKSGEIWVGTENGLNIYNSNNEFKRIYYQNDKTKESENVIYSIHEDNTGLIWIGTKAGLKKLNKKRDKIVDVENAEINNNRLPIGHIIEDFSGILWCSSKNGLLKIDNRQKNFKIFNNFYNKNNKHANNISVYAINKDNENIFWVASNAGIFKLNREKEILQKYYFEDKNHYLPEATYYSLYIDKDENLWAGSNTGLIYILKKNSQKFINFFDLYNIENTYQFATSRISSIKNDNYGNIWIATSNGFFKFANNSLKKYSHSSTDNKSINSNEIKSMFICSNNDIWLGTVNGICKYNKETDNFSRLTINDGLPDNSIMSIHESIDGFLWFGTRSGLSKFDKKNKFINFISGDYNFIDDCFYGILEDDNENLWLSSNHGISKFNYKTEKIKNFYIEHGLQDYEFNIGAFYKTENGEMFFGGLNGLNYFYPDSVKNNTHTPKTVISKIIKGNLEIPLDFTQTIYLKHNEILYIYFTIPEYSNPSNNYYEYRNSEKDSLKIFKEHKILFSDKSPGEYFIEIIGKNNDGKYNKKPATLKVVVLPTFWQTPIMKVSYILIPILLIASISLFFLRMNSISNKLLKEKLIASKDLGEQKAILEEKNQSIIDSINYAKRIIEALLPPIDEFSKIFSESFILHLPKDIVSGDFYWFEENTDNIIIAAIDCTGHGIPGAFMSILGVNLFRDMDINEKDPAKILIKMNRELKYILQTRTTNVKDGMDLALCVVNKKKKTISYSGAKNPLYLIRDDELTQFRANRYAIGQANPELGEVFGSQQFTLHKNDVIYLFSDGYTDQFGGIEGKKFKFRRFRHLLLSIYKKPFEEQKQILNKTITDWRGTMEQVDDILIICFNPLSMSYIENFRTTYDLIKGQ